ncbi:MAG: hypothetical protein VR73_04345 [Gammaproteobacteria bacterium BRH_c0]|nr:MAG: hypothetical protein VR73_04345 [Gammaproteobacteria bacterium BRH_c0]
MEEEFSYIFFVPEILGELASLLELEDICVPGYCPSVAGLYDPVSITYDMIVEGKKFVLLPDRNVTTRLSKAQQGMMDQSDRQFQIAAALLAFCQHMDIQIEPSIAMHELAHKQGNEEAWNELAYVRAADNGDPIVWSSLGVGIFDPSPQPGKDFYENVGDLSYPLRRWNRNYIQVLKIAEIELYDLDLTPLEKIIKLIDWMESDFMLASPAAIFGAVYFAPRNPPRKKLIKNLRSSNRKMAIDGIKNAAWDLTHLSDFAKHVVQDVHGEYRYLFASFDKRLRLIASMLYCPNPEMELLDHTVSMLESWWPKSDSCVIVDRVLNFGNLVNNDEWMSKRPPREDYISSFIGLGETSVMDYRPS